MSDQPGAATQQPRTEGWQRTSRFNPRNTPEEANANSLSSSVFRNEEQPVGSRMPAEPTQHMVAQPVNLEHIELAPGGSSVQPSPGGQPWLGNLPHQEEMSAAQSQNSDGLPPLVSGRS